jgi:hypothetical protein
MPVDKDRKSATQRVRHKLLEIADISLGSNPGENQVLTARIEHRPRPAASFHQRNLANSATGPPKLPPIVTNTPHPRGSECW